MSERLEALRSLAAQNPEDPFVRYGLAMELVNTGDLEQASKEFERLLGRDPDYLAAYYQAGQTLEKLGRTEEARQVYGRGAEVARRQGNEHTRTELEAALELLG